jgi:hypothetical protein
MATAEASQSLEEDDLSSAGHETSASREFATNIGPVMAARQAREEIA